MDDKINNSVAVDIQNVIQTYGRFWNLSESNESKNNDDVIIGRNAHILVIPTKNGGPLSIKCGGTIIEHKIVLGVYIPLVLKIVNLPRGSSDHIGGCERLRYDAHPDVVEHYADSFDRLAKFLYVDNIDIKFDRSRIEETREGFIPVIVNKMPFCVSETYYNNTPIYGYLCMGNCV